MNHSSASLALGLLLSASFGIFPGVHSRLEAQPARRGTITGRVRLMGSPPPNTIIRMGMDPMCAAITRGKRPVQAAVIAGPDGGLANVFVQLQGKFPSTTVPTMPVVIDQRGCMYGPRVVAVRVGQPLQVLNSDDVLHDVHGVSAHGNDFKVSEPKAGMVQVFRLKNEEVMVRLQCDIHKWMTAYIGVVNHPYFAVTDMSGSFTIANVPAGTHTIGIWHERYGALTKTVQVKGGSTSTVDFVYAGAEKAAR